MYWKKKRCSMEVVVGRVHDVATTYASRSGQSACARDAVCK